MEVILLALITAIAPSITIIVTYFFGKKRSNKHAADASAQIQLNADKLNDVHLVVNGRLDKALKDIADLKSKYDQLYNATYMEKRP